MSPTERHRRQRIPALRRQGLLVRRVPIRSFVRHLEELELTGFAELLGVPDVVDQ
jgi:hypothetical protein